MSLSKGRWFGDGSEMQGRWFGDAREMVEFIPSFACPELVKGSRERCKGDR